MDLNDKKEWMLVGGMVGVLVCILGVLGFVIDMAVDARLSDLHAKDLMNRWDASKINNTVEGWGIDVPFDVSKHLKNCKNDSDGIVWCELV